MSRSEELVVCGFDPGTKRIGYGIVSFSRGKAACLSYGKLFQTAPPSLLSLGEETKKLFLHYSPSHVAIERVFFGRNSSSALPVSEARGVLCFLAKEAGLPLLEFTPQEVKSSVSGYGRADKMALARMVKIILGLKNNSLLPDESDALAIALAAVFHLQGNTQLTSRKF
ncbi:MAG: crossover junction endodeoxyribonuclease RuvC [Parcubacteria group bacterium]|nr:crossover junction endodeoxyribonuclease RuvC [Parcubacteria group bacterium]